MCIFMCIIITYSVSFSPSPSPSPSVAQAIVASASRGPASPAVPNNNNLPIAVKKLIENDLENARKLLIANHKWVSCGDLETTVYRMYKVEGYHGYLAKHGISNLRPNFRSFEVYDSVNTHNRWIEAAMRATRAFPFLTAADCMVILDREARTYSMSGNKCRNVSDLGLGDLVNHPTYQELYFFATPITTIPPVNAYEVYMILLSMRLESREKIQAMQLSKKIIGFLNTRNHQMQYASNGMPLSGVLTQSLGLMLRFSFTAEKYLADVVEKCRSLVLDGKGREALTKDIIIDDIQAPWIE